MVRRLLLVLDDCGPGDALVVDFCLEAVLGAYRDAEADLLVGEGAAPVFARDGRFRRVITSRLYEQRSRSRFMLLLRKVPEAVRLALLMGRRYDLAITFYWGTTLLNFLARLATKGRSLGFANVWPRLLDSRLGQYPRGGDPIEQASRLMAAAGLKAAPTTPGPRIEVTDARRAAELLDHHGLAESTRLAVLHTGSDWACQQWLPERWATLADVLAGDLGFDVVFTGLPNEAPYIQRIRDRMRADSVSMAGETNVPELTTLLSRAALCVCVDSLAFELAQGAGTPTVVLAGQSRTETVATGRAGPAVVNRTTPELRAAILACKVSFEKASRGGCLHYGCPMAELRDIEMEDVMDAVSSALAQRVTASQRI